MTWISEVYKEIPEDLHSESVVLGSLLFDINRMDKIPDVRHEMFSIVDGVNRPQMFILLKEYHQGHSEITATGFSDWLEGKQYMKRITEDKFKVIGFFAHAAADLAIFDQAATAVISTWKKKQTVLQCVDTIQKAVLPGGGITETLQHHEQAILDISSSALTLNIFTFRGEGSDLIARMEERINLHKSGNYPGLVCGLQRIDDCIQGYRGGDLVIEGGRSGMGKTSYDRTKVINMAIAGHPQGVVSMEEGARRWMDKCACVLAEIDYRNFRSGNLAEWQIRRINEALAAVETLPIFIDARSEVSAEDFRAVTRVMKKKYRVAAMHLDYIQKLKIPGRQSKTIELGQSAAHIRATAMNYDIPVFALAQLNRDVEKNPDKVPYASNIRDSDQIQHEADVIELVYRPEYYKIYTTENGDPTTNMGIIFIAKARDQGEQPPQVLYFDPINANFYGNYELELSRRIDPTQYNGNGHPQGGETQNDNFHLPPGGFH